MGCLWDTDGWCDDEWNTLTTCAFLFNKTNKTHEFPKVYFVKKLCMFRVFPLPIIRSFLLYIRHWSIYCRFDDSFQAGSGWNIIKKKFVTMHGDMNVYLCVVMLNSDARRSQSQNPFSGNHSSKIWHCDPSKRRNPTTPWCGVVSQKKEILTCTATITCITQLLYPCFSIYFNPRKPKELQNFLRNSYLSTINLI